MANVEQTCARFSISGRAISLTPAIERVSRELRVTSHALIVTDGVCRICRVPSELHWIKSSERYADGTVIPSETTTYSGLESVVQHLLDREHIDYRVVRSEPVRPLEPQFTWVGPRDQPDRDFLSLVAGPTGGLVLYPPSIVQPIDLVIQAIQTFPLARIVIVATRLHELRSWAYHLRQQFHGVELLLDNRVLEPTPRIIVCPYGKLGDGNVETERRDVLFAVRAEETLSEIGEYALAQAQRARLVGFMPWDMHVAPCDECRLAKWFGLDRLAIPSPGQRFRDVRFAFLPSRLFVQESDSSNMLEFIRCNVWLDNKRNWLFAELARALVSQDRAFLEERVPSLLPFLPQDRALGVLVVTSSAVQAAEMRKWLPSWGGSAILGAPGRQFIPGRSIVSPSNITRDSLDGVDVLLRADGAPGCLPFPLEALIDPSDDHRSLLLVDCADGGHPVMQRWADQRRESYLSHEWFDVASDVASQRAERWLKWASQ